MDKKIYAECINDGKESIQINGVKLAQPTDISIVNLDESVCIKWTDPKDVTIDGAPIAEYGGTLVVRKVGSAPTSPTDGIVVADSKIRNQYKDTGFIDTGLVNDTLYYYGIFPYTEEGVHNCKSNISITPTAIYPDAPMNVKVSIRNESLRVIFTLPDNATDVKICYSTTRPESNEVLYGSTISSVESPYIITGLTNDTTYYVTVYSSNEKNRNVPSDIVEATPREARIFSMTIDDNESDPDSKIIYSDDNINFSPAHMDYESDTFNYGDWTPENGAWFMDVKPCMLKYDGEVDYFLDKNNVEYKEDGVTPSDVSNPDYEGNAMVQFPKIFYKKTDAGEGKATYTFSDIKLDDNFECYSNIDSKNNEIDHFYMPMYDGSLINGKLRSISNQIFAGGTNRYQEIDYAKANNLTEDVIWYTNVLCDRLLIQLLLILISKSTDAQNKFGYGNCSAKTGTDIKRSGTLNDKGLFYGKQDGLTCVKVFGMENFWSNCMKSVAGWINDHGTQKIKMTYGTYDGSTVEGYNTDGSGYISIPDVIFPSNNSGGCVSSMKYTKYGLIPKANNGTITTYYCDGVWSNNSQNNYIISAGHSAEALYGGLFCVYGLYNTSITYAYIGSSISCKPLNKSI